MLDSYGDISRPEQVVELQALIRPYLLRRTKSELAQPLPTKRETLLRVSLTPSQMRVYRSIMDHSMEHIMNPRSSLRNVCMQLRKACNHPMLLEEGTKAEQAKLDLAYSAADELQALEQQQMRQGQVQARLDLAHSATVRTGDIVAGVVLMVETLLECLFALLAYLLYLLLPPPSLLWITYPL